MPFTPEVLQARERTPTPFPYVVVTFGLAIKFIKELGGVSHGIRAMLEFDPPIREFQWRQRGLVS